MESQIQNIWVIVLIGVISSLVASCVFLGFLRAIQPNIQICDKIARSEINLGDRGSHSVKVINKNLFTLIDIDARLDLVHNHVIPPDAKPLLTIKNIPLATSHLFEIAKHNLNDNEAKYAIRFAIKGNLEEQWPNDPNSFLLFRLAATHSLSGFRKVFEKRFMRNDLKDGQFHFGDSAEIG